MTPERIQSPYGLWKVDTHPAVIEYSNSVMGEIAAFADDGLQRLARGGIEIGGILFGSRNGTALRIEAWRPILCEHARGPSFLLSPKDEKALGKLLGECESDPDLKGYEALGWFHSHTRSEICLTDDDLHIHDRYFAELWQIALVLRPKRHERVRAGFFVRELGGTLRTGSSLVEFGIEPSKHVVARPQKSVLRSIPASQPEPGAVQHVRRVQSPFSTKWLSLVAVVLLLLTGVRIMIMKWGNEPPGILPVKVSDQFGTLQIEWDRTFHKVVDADAAEISITDGAAEVKKRLDAETVHQGAFQFVRNSEDVRIQLTLFRGGKATAREISRFVGPKSLRGKDAVLERAGSQLQEVTGENVRLREALRKETVRTQRLERTVRTLQERLANRGQ